MVSSRESVTGVEKIDRACVSTAGRAKLAQNSIKAGLNGAAFKWSMVYCEAVSRISNDWTFELNSLGYFHFGKNFGLAA